MEEKKKIVQHVSRNSVHILAESIHEMKSLGGSSTHVLYKKMAGDPSVRHYTDLSTEPSFLSHTAHSLSHYTD